MDIFVQISPTFQIPSWCPTATTNIGWNIAKVKESWEK